MLSLVINGKNDDFHSFDEKQKYNFQMKSNIRKLIKEIRELDHQYMSKNLALFFNPYSNENTYKLFFNIKTIEHFENEIKIRNKQVQLNFNKDFETSYIIKKINNIYENHEKYNECNICYNEEYSMDLNVLNSDISMIDKFKKKFNYCNNCTFKSCNDCLSNLLKKENNYIEAKCPICKNILYKNYITFEDIMLLSLVKDSSNNNLENQSLTN